MKKFFFNSGSNNNTPFWQPWKWAGYWGRYLLFMLLLALLIILLSLFRGCNNVGIEESIVVSDPEWNQPIEGGEEVGLPSRDENRLPSFDELTPIPNPDNGGATEIYPNLLYVIFNSDAGDQVFTSFAQQFRERYAEPEHKIEAYNTSTKTAVLSVPSESRDRICQNLPSEITGIDFMVVPVEVMTQFNTANANTNTASVSSGSFNDPAFGNTNQSWYFEPIQAKRAWSITQGSEDIIIGIVDSYMDLEHFELKGNRAIFPYSVLTGCSDVAPKVNSTPECAGHGTMVTAIATGNANNGQGSAGIAPKCKFIPVSLGDHINTITQVEGILYCIYHGADVVNISSGMYFPANISQLPIDQQVAFSRQYGVAQAKMWDYVFKIAEQKNTTIVWAAGNSNCFCAMDASKRNRNTIRVSSVDRNLKKANFSNYGNFPNKSLYESTISAPGVQIYGALPNNSYDAWDGTSFSAPIITGTVALIKSVNKNLTTPQIIDILKSTGKPIQGAPELGNLVQIYDAVAKAKSMLP